MLSRLVAAAVALSLGSAAQAADTKLAAAFGAREQLQDVSLSPDGTKLAYVVPTTGQGSALLTVSLAKDAKPMVALHATGDPDRIEGCNWISNDRLICTVYWLLRDVSEILPFSRVIAVNADGSNLKTLSTPESAYARDLALSGGDVIDWLPEEDGMALMTRVMVANDHIGTLIANKKTGTVVEKINTRTSSTSRVEPIKEDAFYLSDRHGTVRLMGINLYANYNATGVQRYFYRAVGSRDWKPLVDYNYATDTGFNPQAIDYERNAVYGFRKVAGRRALYRLALDGSMKEELVFARPDVDVDDLIYIGRRHRVVGATYVTDIRQAVYFDSDLAKLAASLGKALPNAPKVRIVEASADEKKLLIWAGSDDDPGVYYVLDRTTHEMAIFQPVRPELEGQPLAKVQPITYPAGDGTMTPAYLTLPVGGAGKRLPAIVLPHGGPSSRDEWGFDWLAQFYAARGFAVLQPNFRGSSGYGDDWFQQNGFKSWRTSIGDIGDAGRWLVRQGIADPAKLAIVGWSYGGYAALQSAVTEPDLFKAVVAIAPVTDLASLKGESRWWSNHKIVGDFVGDGPHVVQGSPAQNAARIKVPILLVHGTMDRNVGFAESQLMDSKLSAAGVPHQFIVFDKLDHQLDDSTARAKLLSESDDFLRKSMGM